MRRSLAILAISLLCVPGSTGARADESIAALVEEPSGPGGEADSTVERLRGEWRADVPALDLALQVAVDGTAERPSLVVTAPRLGIIAKPPRTVEVVEDAIVATLPGPGLVAEFRLEIDPVPRVVVSFPAGPPQVTSLPPAGADLVRIPPVRTAPGASRHDATLQIPGGGRLPITIVLATIDGTAHALIDIPAQGIQGLALVPRDLADLDAEEPLAGEDGARLWRLPMPMPADLLIAPRGDSWQGRFRQGPLALDLDFERAPDATVSSARRPQDPVPPFPYREVEVEVPTPGGHVLAGTVLLPDAESPEGGHPAVVLVTGSGPQNRDEEIMGHRPFRVLADHLARAGIASLRYDDRGIAGSTGEFAGATSFDLADDAAAALAFLQAYPGIDPHRSGIAGHSEGGTVAAIVAAGMAPTAKEASPAFVVSIAGCGVRGDRVLYDQLARIYRASGVDEATIEGIRERQLKVLVSAAADEVDREGLMEALRALQAAQFELQGLEIDDERRASLEAAGMAEMMSPWMQAFIRFDPAEAFAGVDVPVLAVNGTLDLQVWHDLNLPAIEAAVRGGGGSVEIVRFADLNHMLQPAKTGAIEEYGSIDITMAEDAMKTIADWIGARSPVVAPKTDSDASEDS